MSSRRSTFGTSCRKRTCQRAAARFVPFWLLVSEKERELEGFGEADVVELGGGGEGFGDVAETIPDARLTVWPGAGHFGIAKQWPQVLEAVTTAQ